MRLVERMLAGDESAFDTFGERYPRALYRFALRRLDGDPDLTRDLVQTALCKALAKLDTYRGEAPLLTWLCSCCRNEILMHHRSRRIRPVDRELEEALEAAREPVPGYRAPPPGNPESLALDHETSTLVHMALDVLPPHYARALEWKYLELLPVRDVAERLNLRPKAAESLLTRARQAFKAAYQGLRSAPPAHDRLRPRPAREGSAP
jgi:RNA polymerase sigma-70 factor (ECF subfamily)